MKATLAVAGLTAVALSGCSATIDRKDLESKLSSYLQLEYGKRVGVSCPGGESSKRGNTFNCTADAPGGHKATVRIRLKDDHGTFSVMRITQR